MAVKGVFKVDVDDAEFKDFQKEFDKFREEMGTLPGVFNETSEQANALAESMSEMTKFLREQADTSGKRAANDNKSEVAVRKAMVSWTGITRSTREVFAKVKDTTSLLMKWTGISAAIGAGAGLVGGGIGLFGFDRLAGAAGYGRRQSQGLGMGLGEQQAFSNVYGRVLDPDSFLSNIAGARANVASPGAASLYTLGVNPLGKGGTSGTAMEALGAVRGKVKGTSEEHLGILHQANLLGELGLTVEDLRRIKSMTDEDFDKYSKDYAGKSKQMSVSDHALKTMQDFDVALDAAGKRIKLSFIEGLAPLAPQLERLSNAATETINTILKSDGFKWVIEKATKGLKVFADYIDKEEFQKDVKAFIDGIKAIGEFLTQWNATVGRPTTPEQIAAKERFARMDAFERIGAVNRGYDNGPQSATVLNGKLSTDMLELIAKLEGSPDINGKPQVSYRGAIGRYQIMPDTGRALGFTEDDLRDPTKNREAAAKLLAELHGRYKGDTASMLADYNGGIRGAQLWQKGGHDALRNWKSNDPKDPYPYRQTSDYLDRAGFKITVNNNTGGSATTSVAPMGLPFPQ